MAAPKRTEDLQRDRERAGNRRDPITEGTLRPVDYGMFEPDDEWHPIARMVWDAAVSSGQADWYQNSDLAILWSTCEELSLYKHNTRRSGQLLQVIMSTMGDLMMTEGDRRRVRLELQKPKEEEASHSDAAHDVYADMIKDLQPVG